MRFIPDYQLEVLSEEAFPGAMERIEKELTELRACGSFQAFDGINIFYEYFLAEESKASVVIVHGLSEFSKKYYEFIYYTLKQGYNVFIYDQRCHGLSDRLTEQKELLHADHFEDYVKDLAQFIDEVVLKTEDKPLYLYTHSMGGAVGALYLAKYPDKIQKAVFSAPMLEPIIGKIPVWFARINLWLGKWVIGRKTKLKFTSEFDPNVQYSERHGSSRARFEHHIAMRRENPEYQAGPMTIGWVSESLLVGHKILSGKVTGRIKAPILLFSAEKDAMVNNALHHEFVKRYTRCELVPLEGSSHGVLSNNAQMLEKVLTLTFAFYRA